MDLNTIKEINITETDSLEVDILKNRKILNPCLKEKLPDIKSISHMSKINILKLCKHYFV